MTLLAVQRPRALGKVRPQGVLAQRRGVHGGGGATVSPLAAGGRPLDAGVRGRMETGFGHDFSGVRVHDHPAAHIAAASAGALAYTAGQDVVFAAGQYAPQTPCGAALLAHELAHTVQQAGVQHKAAGPVPIGTDARLEAEADAAAVAVTSGGRAGALSRICAPTILRVAAGSTPGSSKSAAVAADPSLPPGMTLIEEHPEGVGATLVKVQVAGFELPLAKGAGSWVKSAYKAAGDGGRLIFSPLFNGSKVAAFKEGAEDYQSTWVNNVGFPSLKALGAAIGASTDPAVKTAMTDKAVAEAVSGMATGGLKASGFDIDHIVEKQIGGTSIPSNLQLLVAKKNQASGRETYGKMVGLVEELLKPQYRPRAKDIQIRFASIKVPDGDLADPCFKIETLLRSGAIKGSDALITAAQGVPVLLSAGGQGETVRITDAPTPIDSSAKRVVPGMRLKTYVRKKAPGKGKAAVDEVRAELDSRAVKKTGADADILFTAALGPAAPDTTAGVGGKAAAEDKAALSASGEARILKFKEPRPKKAGFYYPYLSPGELTGFEMAADGAVTSVGVIHPSVAFLPDVHISYGPDLLKASAPLDAKKFKSPIPMIRFTGGQLALDLAPEFVPSGALNFEIGPEAKPLMLGKVEATAPGGVFHLAGTLSPGAGLPGIKDATGEVAYDADKGWSGSLKATSSKLPSTTVSLVAGFGEQGGKFVTHAEGGLTTTVRDKSLTLNAAWGPKGIVYTGGLEWPKPFPIVETVSLKGSYGADLLELDGTSKFHFKQWDGDVAVRYRQKDGQEGKFSGTGQVKVETKNKKAAGALNVAIDDKGEITGHGDITYQLTDKITPKLGVSLEKGEHLRISGEVEVGDIELFKKWPESGGEKTLMSLKPSFKIPTPIPAVNAAINIEAGVGLFYGVGPGRVTGVVISGAFDPLEEHPNVTASLTGKFVIPTSFGLTGKVAAKIGVEVAGGAVGVDGGVQVRPKVGVSADATVDVAAKYDKGGFAFEGKAYIDVTPKATLDVDLVASIYAAWHALEYGWSYKVGSLSYTFPQNIKINVGKIGYSSVTGMVWPKLSDVSMEPADISPLKMIEDIMAKRKTTEGAKPAR